jgi:RNA polymerase sigma-70 factor (ECF subfamily)
LDDLGNSSLPWELRRAVANLDKNPVKSQGEVDIDRSMGFSSDEQRRFEMLYDAHRLAVLAYCTRRVSAADAADACSETFLVAWRRIDDVPPSPKTLPYLYGIAARVISNQRRTFHRRSRLHERLRALGATPPGDPAVLYVEDARDDQVIAALSRLKPKDREIVMLYAWEALPRDTIAEMMGMTRAAVDQRIYRAYQRLAQMLGAAVERSPVSPPTAETGSA